MASPDKYKMLTTSTGLYRYYFSGGFWVLDVCRNERWELENLFDYVSDILTYLGQGADHNAHVITARQFVAAWSHILERK